MPEDPSGQQLSMQGVIELHERIAKLEQGLEMALEPREERIKALEDLVRSALHDKGGILERLQHFDACMDGIKKQLWTATGGLALLIVLANWWFGHK